MNSIYRGRVVTKNVDQISVPVNLLADNELSVQLHGKPGGVLTIEIIGEGNTPPMAEAGPDQTVFVGSTVHLDGSGSSDLDGDLLNYRWTIESAPAGSLAQLSDITAITPSVEVDLPGLYDIGLVVNDGTEDSVPDNILISTENSPPIANAGSDQTLFVNDTVLLDGSASNDVDGDLLQYQWTLTTRPDFSLSELLNSDTANPDFQIDQAGTYIAELIVNDGQAISDPDTVEINTANSRPVAEAGAEQTVSVGDLVTLDASQSSDVDGDSLLYSWSLISVPEGSLTALFNSQSEHPTLIPDRDGIYVVQLVVNDGQIDSEPDTVTMTAENDPPVITSTPITTAKRGEDYRYDVEASDPNGDTLSYALTDSPSGMQINASTGLIEWVPTSRGNSHVTVQVQDPSGSSASQSFTVSVVTNKAPVFTSTPITAALTSATYQYALTATDVDGDSLTFSLVNAPTGMTINNQTDTIEWQPDSAGAFAVSVQVSDSQGGTDLQLFSINVTSPNQAPMLDPIGNQTVDLGSTLALNLSATDPDTGDAIHYSVTPLPLPAGARLDALTGEFTFTPSTDDVGNLDLTFTVSDHTLSDSETVTVTVNPPQTGAPTQLSACVIDANDASEDAQAGINTPIGIENATVSILGTTVSAATGPDGCFTLSDENETDKIAGDQILDIDTANASPGPNNSSYAGFRESIDLIANVENQITRPLYLPRIDSNSQMSTDSNGNIVVENQVLAQQFVTGSTLMLTIPSNVGITKDGSAYTGPITISEVPRDLAPAPLPDFLDPGLLITIQPVGVEFSAPVPITFPNIDNLAPGNEVDIWSLDTDTGEFAIVGVGQVSSDGLTMATIQGGIERADWHLLMPPQATATGQGHNATCGCGNKEQTNSTVDSRAGWMNTDFSLPPYQSLGQSRALRFVYRSDSAFPTPIYPLM